MSLFSRGQMGLDLLLAMIVLLVVLTGFSTVLSQFELTHSEIGVRQQLRENAFLSSAFIGSSMNHFRLTGNYPATDTLPYGIDLPTRVRRYAHFTGSAPLVVVRGVGTPQGYDCLSFFDFGDSNTITFQVSAEDLGMNSDVNARGTFPYREAYINYHTILLDGCVAPIRIEEN